MTREVGAFVWPISSRAGSPPEKIWSSTWYTTSASRSARVAVELRVNEIRVSQIKQRARQRFVSIWCLGHTGGCANGLSVRTRFRAARIRGTPGILVEERGQILKVTGNAAVTVKGDREFANLIDNPVKYSLACRSVHVPIASCNGDACVEVQDSGSQRSKETDDEKTE